MTKCCKVQKTTSIGSLSWCADRSDSYPGFWLHCFWLHCCVTDTIYGKMSRWDCWCHTPCSIDDIRLDALYLALNGHRHAVTGWPTLQPKSTSNISKHNKGIHSPDGNVRLAALFLQLCMDMPWQISLQRNQSHQSTQSTAKRGIPLIEFPHTPYIPSWRYVEEATSYPVILPQGQVFINTNHGFAGPKKKGYVVTKNQQAL